MNKLKKYLSLMLAICLVFSMMTITTIAATFNAILAPIFVVGATTNSTMVADALTACNTTVFAVPTSIDISGISGLTVGNMIYYCPTGTDPVTDLPTWKTKTGVTANIIAMGPGINETHIAALKGLGVVAVVINTNARCIQDNNGVKVVPIDSYSRLTDASTISGALQANNGTAITNVAQFYGTNGLKQYTTYKYILASTELNNEGLLGMQSAIRIAGTYGLLTGNVKDAITSVAPSEAIVVLEQKVNQATYDYYENEKFRILLYKADGTSSSVIQAYYYEGVGEQLLESQKREVAAALALVGLGRDVEALTELAIDESALLRTAQEAVDKAETTKTAADYNIALDAVSKLLDSAEKTALITRLNTIKTELDKVNDWTSQYGQNSEADIEAAKVALATAQAQKTTITLNKAETLVKALMDCKWKTEALATIASLKTDVTAAESLLNVLNGEKVPSESVIKNLEELVANNPNSDLNRYLDQIKRITALYEDYLDIKGIKKTKWDEDDYDDLKDIFEELEDMDESKYRDYVLELVRDLLDDMCKELDIQDRDILKLTDDEEDAFDLVEKAEKTPTQKNYDKAVDAVDDLKKRSDYKEDLEDRLEIVATGIELLSKIESYAKVYSEANAKEVTAMKSKVEAIATKEVKAYVTKEYNKLVEAYNIITKCKNNSTLTPEQLEEYKRQASKLGGVYEELVIANIGGTSTNVTVNGISTEMFPFTVTVDEYALIQKNFPDMLSKCTVSSATPALGTGWTDMRPSHWAYKDALSCASYGYLAGLSTTQFGPKLTLKVSDTFTAIDRVLLGSSRYHAIQQKRADIDTKLVGNTHWAYYTTGSVLSRMSSSTISSLFGTSVGNGIYDKQLTRQEVALVIYDVMHDGMPAAGMSKTYNDAASIAYPEAVNWCSSVGILKGDNNGNFNPTSTITRAELCAIVLRLHNMK